MILSEMITIDMLNLETYKNVSDKNSVNPEMIFEVENREPQKPLELIFPTSKSKHRKTGRRLFHRICRAAECGWIEIYLAINETPEPLL